MNENIDVKMGAYFSPSQALFYAANMVDDGSYGKSLPDDLIELPDAETEQYWRVSPPEGKKLGSVNGHPAWVDVPPLTAEQQAEIAITQRAQLRIRADSEIAWRQDAVDADIATDEEKSALAAWRKYRVLLMRVDPAKPEWPKVPVA